MLKSKDILNNISEIDKILENDETLNQYIESFEVEENIQKAPEDLKIKIKDNCTKLEKKRDNIRKIRQADIIKIAACALFAVIIWEGSMNIMKTQVPKNMDSQMADNQIEKKKNLLDKVNDEFRNFSRHVTSPIENKKDKGDNK